MDWLSSSLASTSTIKPEEVDLMINAPFPSPREVSHFFLNRLLPLWLPQSAKLSDQTPVLLTTLFIIKDLGISAIIWLMVGLLS
jgi:hypothetical protein